MIQQCHGNTGSVAQRRFAIVVSKYHLSITEKLLNGAVQTLVRNEVPEANISTFWVPGAWEIPTAAQFALEQGNYDAILTFGCVIRGETTHDQHINTTVSNSLGRLSIEHNTPIAFGLLTCNTMDQAIARAGGEVGHKGIETADAAIHMLLLRQEIEALD